MRKKESHILPSLGLKFAGALGPFSSRGRAGGKCPENEIARPFFDMRRALGCTLSASRVKGAVFATFLYNYIRISSYGYYKYKTRAVIRLRYYMQYK